MKKEMWKVEYKDLGNGFEFEDVFKNTAQLLEELKYLTGIYDEIRITKIFAE